MSQNLIKGALENKVISILPNIATEYENVSYTPISGTPYQQLFFMPAINEGQFINDKSYVSRGVFQINLLYPSGLGTADVMARAQLYVDNFGIGTALVNQGQKVMISDTPDVVRLGKNGDRYIVVVSVNWRAFEEVI